MKLALLLIFFFAIATSTAQVGIGTTTPHPSAELDISTASYTIYANDTLSFIWNGSKWLQIAYSDN